MKSRLKAFVAMASMVACTVVAHAWKPTDLMAEQRPPLHLEEVFPDSFGSWAVDERVPVQLISPDTAALLSKIYSQTLSRTYVNAQGDRIMLSVAYGGDQSEATRAHRPEVCYPAQGFEILSSSSSSISTSRAPLRVRNLVAKLGPRIEPITYWIVVGDHVALSGTEQKLQQIRYSVRGTIPDGMLVRISSIDSDSDRAYEVQAGFIREMSTAMPSGFVTRVMGSETL